MEGSSPAPITSSPLVSHSRYSKLELNVLIIEQTFGDGSGDSNSAAIDSLPKGLEVSAQKIIDKLNELLQGKVPKKIEELSPDEVTPEATADRIVAQVTALFDVYAKQNPNGDNEEVLNSFMEQVRSGVQKGYDDAFEILKGLGAFEFEGVQEGIEKTKLLIEQKLQAFESFKRQDLGLDTNTVRTETATGVSAAVLQQAGASVQIQA